MPESIAQQFKSLLEENLSIDLTRGKPSSSQLDLSNELLSIPLEPLTEDGVDIRNYGEPLGMHQAREWGAELLDSAMKILNVTEKEIIFLSSQLLLASQLFVINGRPWKDIENPTFICPTPGFDRHFNMLDELGIEMLSVPLVGNGLDLEILKTTLAEHDDIIGLISVPRHSTPSGDIYSDKNILKIFELCSEYSKDLIFLFDHAYLIHDLTGPHKFYFVHFFLK